MYVQKICLTVNLFLIYYNYILYTKFFNIYNKRKKKNEQQRKLFYFISINIKYIRIITKLMNEKL